MDWAIVLGVTGGALCGGVVVALWARWRGRLASGGDYGRAGMRIGSGRVRDRLSGLRRRRGGDAHGGSRRTAIATQATSGVRARPGGETVTMGRFRRGDPGGRELPADPRGGLAEKALDSLRVGVVVLDPGDEPVLTNPSARAMGLLRAGAQPGAVAAHPVVRTLAAQVRRSGVRREVELDLPREGADGAADPLGVLLRAVGLGGGFVAVEAADATESHRVARVRRDFVANVGHELKTPIGALQLLSEALLDATAGTDGAAGSDGSDGSAGSAGHDSAAGPPAGGQSVAGQSMAEDVAAARRFAERIHAESTRLGQLVNELLELSRVQGAEPLPAREPVAVDWLVAEVVDRSGTAAAAKDVALTVTGEEGLTVYGSGSQLATALANLVDNAVAYSPEGSQVEIRRGHDGEQVTVAVVDQGIGIAAKELDRVFERFYRSDRARSRATGGTGLGLAIVKHIATNHGGRVEVHSAPGEGSTFTLRLPARPVPAEPAPPGSGGVEEGRLGPGRQDDGAPGGGAPGDGAPPDGVPPDGAPGEADPAGGDPTGGDPADTDSADTDPADSDRTATTVPMEERRRWPGY